MADIDVIKRKTKVLLLAAGYATRLYPLTKDRPKPLLPVAGRPMLEHIIEKIAQAKDISSVEINEIIVVTNQKFYEHFTSWADKFESPFKISVLNDGTLSDDDKLGAVGDMNFVITQQGTGHDLMVIAGDNLFDFNLQDFIESAMKHLPYSTVGLYDVGEKELVKKYSQVSLNEQLQITGFEEKPSSPKGTLIAICMYYFPAEKLELIKRYIKEGNNPDQPGHYIHWLYQADKVYGHVFRGRWYDIGDMGQYQQADQEFSKEEGD